MRIRFHHHWTDQRILLDLFTEFADHVAVPNAAGHQGSCGRPRYPTASGRGG
jgi:hypothetical protein